MGQRTIRRKRRRTEHSSQKTAAKEASVRLSSALEAIERLRTRRAAYKYGCRVLCFFILFLIILVLIYAPQEKVELLTEILDKIYIPKALYGFIVVILGLIAGGLWFGRGIASALSDTNSEV